MVRILMSAAIAVVLLLQPAAAQRDRDRRPDRPDAAEVDREVLLGEKSVGFRVDRDTINIGQSEDWFRNRSFRSLRFHADRNDVHMMALDSSTSMGTRRTFAWIVVSGQVETSVLISEATGATSSKSK